MIRTPELAALESLVRTAERRGLRVLLIGAIARQLVFDQRNSKTAYRATRDVDTVVRVSGWEEFNALVAEMVATGGFSHMGGHQFRYRDGTEVDLLPFGGVADPSCNLTWEGADRAMSLEGLETADSNSESIELNGIHVRVANLPSLLALKLFAFRDRHARTSKDLSDLIYIFANGSYVLMDRVYKELNFELTELDFDQLGPFLLGQDVNRIVPQSERDALIAILEKQILEPPDYSALSRLIQGEELDRSIARFEAFRRGMVGK
jgi:predicted nucleotidyltransferase